MRKIETPDRACEYCGSLFNRRKRSDGQLESFSEFRGRRFCSTPCYGASHRGRNNHMYKDGGSPTIYGYIRTTDPNGSGYRGHLHRIIMQQKLGRRLRPDEHVHHIDGDKTNNNLSNLELIDASQHARHHGIERKARITHCTLGHPYSPDNTYVNPRNGHRQCRTCHRIEQRKYRERKQA